MILAVKTSGKRAIMDITGQISDQVQIDNGVVYLFVQHTTAAITTADLDPGGTDQDYLDAFEQIIPKLDYRHPHDPAHMPDHILASIIGPSLSVPVENGQLQLGTWQRIVLLECDGPRERKIMTQQIAS